MRQIGRNKEPLEPSDQQSAHGFFKDVKAGCIFVAESKGKLYGVAMLKSVPIFPYGKTTPTPL